MPAPLLPPRRAPLRRAMLALLVLGLLLQAQAGVLRQLLGAAHWHRPVAMQAQPVQADGGWLARLQAWRLERLASSPLAAAHPLAAPAEGHHHHDGLARHHHAPQLAGLVPLEPTGGDDGSLADGLAGSLLQPLALAAPWRLPAQAAANGAWPGGPAAPWRSAGLRQPERPPRA